MNSPCNIIIVSRKPALWLVTAVLAVATTAFAHAGFDHVMGTVIKVSGNVVTVKTAKGNVDVKLGDRTELASNGQQAQLADLKLGTRVVAEVAQGSKDNMAQSVKIGATPKTAAARHSHGSHK